MRDAVFRASVRGARRPGRNLSRAGRRIQAELLDQMGYRLAPALTRIYRRHAPHDRGGLERGLQASVRSYAGRITTTIRSTAVSEDGFAYTDVTRFGHRVAVIKPKGGRQFLRFPSRTGGYIFARQVKGYRPPFDWAERAAHEAEREVEKTARDVGRAIATRLL